MAAGILDSNYKKNHNIYHSGNLAGNKSYRVTYGRITSRVSFGWLHSLISYDSD